MKCLITVLSALIFLNSIAQDCVIQGRVMDLYTNKPLKGAVIEFVKTIEPGSVPGAELFYYKYYTSTGVLISQPSTSVVVKRIYSNENGYFNIQPSDTSFRIFCYYKISDYEYRYSDRLDYDMDSTTIAENLKKNIHTIRVTCKYDSTSLLDHCPQCKKKDQLKKMVWGGQVLDLNGDSFDNDGVVIKDKDRDKYYPGGCSVDWCRGKKYCGRCKLKF